jgi:catechol 2,3-dioxygenase-like lactoylglutathione lyase family enzyme
MEGVAMSLGGAHHVGLTVTDVARSREWYTRLFDWQPLFDGEEDGRAFAVGVLPSGLVLGFSRHSGTTGAFDAARVGLDHLAFGVASRAEVVTWEQRLAELGIDYTPVIDAPYGHVLNFRDPDGIALEIFAMRESEDQAGV